MNPRSRLVSGSLENPRAIPPVRWLVVQKVIDVVGVSPKSFADAAKNAVSVAAQTVRDLRWARVSEFELDLKDNEVETYRATVRIYFDVERNGKPSAVPAEPDEPPAEEEEEPKPAPKRRRRRKSGGRKATEPKEDE